jgi:hypothetical protein
VSAILTAEQVAGLQSSGRIRVTWRDDGAPHQIRIHLEGGRPGWIAVTCTCRQRSRLGPLDSRTCWDGPAALAVYEAHLPAEVTA